MRDRGRSGKRKAQAVIMDKSKQQAEAGKACPTVNTKNNNNNNKEINCFSRKRKIHKIMYIYCLREQHPCELYYSVMTKKKACVFWFFKKGL